MSPSIRRLADRLDVQVACFNVIYHLVDDLKMRLSACLPDETELKLVAEGRVLKEFLISDRDSDLSEDKSGSWARAS
uniref:Ubiquitin-like domain-containing protein n=1 Tax=Parascaris equorum TaxID=6256 RepID=A0A914RFT6_PAREQ